LRNGSRKSPTSTSSQEKIRITAPFFNSPLRSYTKTRMREILKTKRTQACHFATSTLTRNSTSTATCSAPLQCHPSILDLLPRNCQETGLPLPKQREIPPPPHILRHGVAPSDGTVVKPATQRRNPSSTPPDALTLALPKASHQRRSLPLSPSLSLQLLAERNAGKKKA
jgi:hypothetical protein